MVTDDCLRLDRLEQEALDRIALDAQKADDERYDAHECL